MADMGDIPPVLPFPGHRQRLRALAILHHIEAAAAPLDACGPAAAAWRRWITAALSAARSDLISSLTHKEFHS